MADRFRASLLVSLFFLVPCTTSGQWLRVYYPDIEQGSSTLVVSPTGSALLVDGGTQLDPVDDDIVRFIADLIETGVVVSLDYVVATHYDEDHIGRLEDVLNFGVSSPSVITYDRGDVGDTPNTFAFFDYLDAALAHNRTTITPLTDIDLGGGVTVECVAVNGELRDGSVVDVSGSGQFENSSSVALVVRYGDFDLWIGGDLTGNIDFGVADVETPAGTLAGDLDVYTVDHHGSRSSSTPTFLAEIRPEVTINQSSVSNSFGHPTTEVVSGILANPDSNGLTPAFYQLNRGNPDDTRSDDALATGIADPDDLTDVLGLSGAVTILSDGTSYQIHGGDLTPVVRAADSGPGTLGDYPPTLRNSRRAPLVPLAAEAVLVEVEAEDETLASVDLRYRIDGIEAPRIAMSEVPGTSTYQASLPGQLDGARVDLWIEASDAGGRITSSPFQSYYSGVTPVATFSVNDASGLLTTRGAAARIEVSLTAEPGIFSGFVAQMYAQDAGGGLLVFDAELPSLARGDLVQFVGEIQQVSGQTEVNIAETFGNFGYTLIAPGPAPAPLTVTVAQVDESVEGRLIRIDGVTVVDGEIPVIGNGTLTVSDDGGVSTLTLFVDGDTDIPNAETPTQPFDLIGVAAQFDTRYPFTEGYEIIPRGREDFLSDEVQLPSLLINEIFAAPDLADGDANNDGAVVRLEDQFLELVNTTFGALDISGWRIGAGGAVRHVFPPGTVVPAREAIVVFGGGTPVGPFGNAEVQTASSGSLRIHPQGSTVGIADAGANIVQVVTYPAIGIGTSAVRSPDATNTPFLPHETAPDAGGAIYSPGTRADGQTFSIQAGGLLLSEVMYDPEGGDNLFEWVELYNPTAAPIELKRMSLGNGGSDYTSSLVQLSGTVPAGATFVVGGPFSDPDNGSPVFDLEIDFSPDFQNGGATADGVALFNVPVSEVTPTTVPIDAVVYGDANDSLLIDETGVASSPEVGDAPSGFSIERLDLAGSWTVGIAPTPGSWPPPPPPMVTGVILSEVLYDPTGSDGQLEWVELHNTNAFDVDLASMSLGNGGGDYTSSVVQLSGTIVAGGVFVVGGPLSGPDNADPVFDLALDFSPDFQNSGAVADGVALFDIPAALITSSTVPVDAVVYGGANDNGLIDETGSANAPEVGDAPSGSSVERLDVAGSWQIQAAPSPNSSPL